MATSAARALGERTGDHGVLAPSSDPAGRTVKDPRISTGLEPTLIVTWNEIVRPAASTLGVAAFASPAFARESWVSREESCPAEAGDSNQSPKALPYPGQRCVTKALPKP